MIATLADTPVLETERLTLRAPIPSDIAPWVAFLVSDRGVWHGGGPENGEGGAWRVAATFAGHWLLNGFGLFVAVEKATGRPVASAGPYAPPDFPEIEIGWSVWSDEDQGKGYASEAAKAIIAHCRDDLKLPSLVSYIAPENARSCALAERLGAVLDAKAKRPHPDDLVYRHFGEAA